MKRIRPLLYWVLLGLLFPIGILNLWVGLQLLNFLQSFIAIFAAGMLLSFILNYPVRLLERFRFSRTQAVFIILLIVLGAMAILGATLVPMLISQLNDLVQYLPDWIQSGRQQLQSFQAWSIARGWPVNLSHWASQLEAHVSSQLQSWSGKLLLFLVGTVGSVFHLMLTLVVTFYLLLHGDRLWDGLFQWLPLTQGALIRTKLHQNFHNYFVGQISLAVLMGTAMTLAFILIRVPFSLLFGLSIGILAIFPFGTPLGIAIVTSLTALKSVWLGVEVLIVAFLIDQGIENIIAPQILGKFTGLNPVWILASLLLGAQVGGLLGLITAVPLASFVKSLLDHYRAEPSTTAADV